MYYNLQSANAIFNPEFEEWKGEFFDYVKKTFDPSFQNETFDNYTFFIDQKRWMVRYDRGIKCWMLFTEGDHGFILNKYDVIEDEYIDSRGGLAKLRSESIDERFFKHLRDEYGQLMARLTAIEAEQRQGIRKVVYPKRQQYGRISRQDFYKGMSEEQRQNYWAFKFAVEDIKYIVKQPVIAPLTLREYFRLCRIYYLANSGEFLFRDVPDDPKAAYMRFSDRRTEQMEAVDLDDPQDFYDWVKKKGRWKDRDCGGHPYEIAGKTYLYPRYTDGLSGYYVWSGFIWCYNEAVTLCREPNLMLSDGEYLVEIIKGNGMLEVTPSFNRYGYPNKDFQEPTNYDDLTQKQRNKIVWDELKEAQRKYET